MEVLGFIKAIKAKFQIQQWVELRMLGLNHGINFVQQTVVFVPIVNDMAAGAVHHAVTICRIVVFVQRRMVVLYRSSRSHLISVVVSLISLTVIHRDRCYLLYGRKVIRIRQSRSGLLQRLLLRNLFLLSPPGRWFGLFGLGSF